MFVAMGAAVTVLGQWLIDYRVAVQRVGGAMVILLGLYLVGVLRVPFLMRQFHLPLSRKPAGLFGSAAVGITFGVAWTPCVGPILGAILTLASTTQTAGQGIVLLAAYAAGLAVPFLAAALALDQFLAFFSRFRPLLPVVDRVAGVMLVGVGLLLVLNYLTMLNGYFISFTPQWLLERL